jgi:hypothetical protein
MTTAAKKINNRKANEAKRTARLLALEKKMLARADNEMRAAK